MMGVSSGLEPHVLVGRGVGIRRDQGQRGLLGARAHPADEAVLPDRGEDLLLEEDALDLVQQLLALLVVALARLAIVEILHLGQHPRGVGAALHGHDGQARGRVAGGAEPPNTSPLSLPWGEEEKNAARSMVRIFTRMPTAAR